MMDPMSELDASTLEPPKAPEGFKKVSFIDLTGGFTYTWIMPEEDAARMVAYGNARKVW